MPSYPAATGSSKYRQYNNYIAGFTPYYALFMPGAMTFYAGPSTYTAAVDGLTTDDSLDGETPQTAVRTLAQGQTLMTAGRGDTLVLLPGTYTLTSILAWTKSQCRIVSLIPYAATVTGDGVITALMRLNAVSDLEIAGIRFTQAAALTTGIGVATVGTAACNRVWIHHCQFVGGAVAASTAIVNGQNQAGNDALDTKIEWCEFSNWSAQAINTFGGRCKIWNNVIRLSTAGGATGLTVGDQGAAFTRDWLSIRNNGFIGGSDASALLAWTFAGALANTQMWEAWGNAFASCAAPTANIHAQGAAGPNYVGTGTGVAPTLWTA